MLRRLVVVGAAVGVAAFQLPVQNCKRPARPTKTAAALIEDTQATSAAVPDAAENSLDSAAGVPPETDTFAPPKRDVSRTLRLRDSVWVRQAMDDLVAAEFALRLELEESQQDEEESFVDFARLREQLDSRLVELESGAGKSKIAARDRAALRSRARDTAAALADAEAAAAARRSSDHVEEVVEEEEDKQFWRELLAELRRRRDAVAELGWYALKGPPKNKLQTNRTAVLYVRQDGSVDWEGALQGAKAATAFSVDLWRRINGVSEEPPATDEPEVEVPFAESGSFSQQRREAGLKAKASQAVSAAEALLAARQALDDVDEISGAKARAAFRRATALLGEAEGNYVSARLELALERCCAALEASLDASTSPVEIQDRRVVAEFALLDAQLVALARDARSVGAAILRAELDMLGKEIRDFSNRLGIDRFDNVRAFYDALKASGEFEDSALLLVFDEAQLGKLAGGSKERPQETSLGLLLRSRAAKAGSGKRFSSNMLSGVGAFYDAIANFLSSMRTQISRGWTFYVDGSRLLFNDVGFSASLVGRAFAGETLVPRDVRVLRRTVKDLLTTVPFIIILLIPLSPVGHVFVFGAIQRFFPDFFPSCYTERRQNLVKLYAAAELDRLPERRKPGADTIFKL
ncbi:unnamed protein product [Pelagomonas calceolata]|uniref:Letm1 RBD domain-containing protein n=1 Tax=Pelagomonas calceolata TaxID=35677 RepID=A0A7S4EE55_9STRA|nr:unnamed protein product [Pelagomonas calceolata]|mmetsp:Transcript_15088/g.42880  ORF Transcript_15088/g.42880 Transcript_15088/m.42880 type:complete len:637 (+) Transcript_15088:152-2062(+)